MSSTRPAAAESGAAGEAPSSSDDPSAGSMSARTPLRGAVAAVALLAVVGAGAAGGAVGYQMGKSRSGGFLSGAAPAEASAFAAPGPRQVAHKALEEVRSDYESLISAMVREQTRLQAALEQARKRQKEARRELGRTERAFTEASRELHEASRKLASLRAKAEREDAEAAGDAEALASAKSKLKDLRLELAAAESEKDGLSRTLETLAGTMEKVIAERDAAAAKAGTLDEHIAALAEKQDDLLGQVENAARLSLSGMRKMFERAGVDLERILGETREDYTGAGGPFEALADEVSDRSDATEARVAALMTDLEEVNLMRFAAQRLPFGIPVQGTRRTSGFGGRDDPLGRGRAMHKGQDFAGPKDTPIYATAEGVVTFSGAQRGYGRIVIIRHAFGFETRYAHLNRSHVKVGERVERGDHIADMGNTGRSTGTHLHYEVRIDREAVNPANFIEAAHDVL